MPTRAITLMDATVPTGRQTRGGRTPGNTTQTRSEDFTDDRAIAFKLAG